MTFVLSHCGLDQRLINNLLAGAKYASIKISSASLSVLCVNGKNVLEGIEWQKGVERRESSASLNALALVLVEESVASELGGVKRWKQQESREQKHRVRETRGKCAAHVDNQDREGIVVEQLRK